MKFQFHVHSSVLCPQMLFIVVSDCLCSRLFSAHYLAQILVSNRLGDAGFLDFYALEE